MARFKLTRETPTGRMNVTYGFDRHVGFFCTVTRGRNRLVDYDSFHPDYADLPGLLHSLVVAGVVTQDDMNEALRILPLVEDVQEIDDNDVRLAVEILSNLKNDAGQWKGKRP